MKHSYTKLLCGIALTAFCGIVASAEMKKAVVVISTDGSQREEVIENVDRIELGSNSLTLKSVGGAAETVDYKDIDRVMIGAEWTAVKKITAPGEIAVWPVTTSDVINISGLAKGEPVTVYNVKGAAAVQTVAGGELTSLSLKQLQAGVYVVTAGSKSVKIIKK